MSTAIILNLTEDGLWTNPWGISADDKPPEKAELFSGSTWGMEDDDADVSAAAGSAIVEAISILS